MSEPDMDQIERGRALLARVREVEAERDRLHDAVEAAQGHLDAWKRAPVGARRHVALAHAALSSALARGAPTMLDAAEPPSCLAGGVATRGDVAATLPTPEEIAARLYPGTPATSPLTQMTGVRTAAAIEGARVYRDAVRAHLLAEAADYDYDGMHEVRDFARALARRIGGAP